jgi:alpha-glucosidase
MTLYRLLAAFVFAFITVPATAQTIAQAAPTTQTVATASSPSGTMKVDVLLNPEGRVGYSVSREGKPVIAESRLGFLFTDAPQMLRNFMLAGQSTRSFDETWEQPWGEYRSIRNRYNELTVNLEEKSGDKRRMTVVFRVYDDGVGFRYEIPKHAKLTRVNIADELTEFNVAEGGEAWWNEALEWNREGICDPPHAA